MTESFNTSSPHTFGHSPTGLIQDNPVFTPEPVQRASTWPPKGQFEGVPQLPGVERRWKASPTMRPLGLAPWLGATQATQLLNAMPVRAGVRIKTLTRITGSISQIMRHERANAGSARTPQMDEPLTLFSSRQTWPSDGAEAHEFTVFFSAIDGAEGLAVGMNVFSPGAGLALAGRFAATVPPVNPQADDLVSQAQQGIFMIATALANLRLGHGEQIPFDSPDQCGFRIMVPMGPSAPGGLNVEIHAQVDGGFELIVSDAVRGGFAAQFPAAEDTAPEAAWGSALLGQMPKEGSDNFLALTNLFSAARNAMTAHRLTHPGSTGFPALGHALALNVPEQVGAPASRWSIHLSALPAGRPGVTMTLDSSDDGNRKLRGHFEWVGQAFANASAPWAGRADAQSSARQAIVVLGAVLPHLHEGRGEAVPALEGETGRIRLEPPLPEGAPRVVVELGYRTDGGLRLQLENKQANATLVAEFDPGVTQLLSPSMPTEKREGAFIAHAGNLLPLAKDLHQPSQIFEDLQLLSATFQEMLRSHGENPINLSLGTFSQELPPIVEYRSFLTAGMLQPEIGIGGDSAGMFRLPWGRPSKGSPVDQRTLTSPDCLKEITSHWFREFRAAHPEFDGISDHELRGKVHLMPEFGNSLQAAIDEAPQFDIELRMRAVDSGTDRSGSRPGAPNARFAIDFKIKDLEDNTLRGHMTWITPPKASDQIALARRALSLTALAFKKLPYGSGRELPPHDGQRRRMALALPGQTGGQDRFDVELSVGEADETVELEISDRTAAGKLAVTLLPAEA
ncbi:MAG: hypothetical protein ABW032_06370 [Burkholderiaceae bacterium]